MVRFNKHMYLFQYLHTKKEKNLREKCNSSLSKSLVFKNQFKPIIFCWF